MRVGLLCDFAVANVEHLSSARVVCMLACAHTLLIDGNSRSASWPLANIYQDDKFDSLNNDADIDKRVAAYLLISGLVLGEFCTETLKKVDWQSRCEAAEARCEAMEAQINEQAQTISEQTQEIRALIAALKQLRPAVAATI